MSTKIATILRNFLNKDNCHQKYLCENIIDNIRCSQCKYCNDAVKICPNYKVKIKYHAYTAIKKHNAVQKLSRIGTKADSLSQEFKNHIADRIKNGISPVIEDIIFLFFYIVYNRNCIYFFTIIFCVIKFNVIKKAIKITFICYYNT